jgi:hypothetical protein
VTYALKMLVVVAIALVVWALLFLRSSNGAESRQAANLVRDFKCIHHWEGAWNDPNPPYWGGLQMDMAFQRRYGREFLHAFGTADHWPSAIQITVAIRAYLSGRGFWPWPNTARRCGLLP